MMVAINMHPILVLPNLDVVTLAEQVEQVIHVLQDLAPTELTIPKVIIAHRHHWEQLAILHIFLKVVVFHLQGIGNIVPIVLRVFFFGFSFVGLAVLYIFFVGNISVGIKGDPFGNLLFFLAHSAYFLFCCFYTYNIPN